MYCQFDPLVKNKNTNMYLKYIYFMLSILQIHKYPAIVLLVY